MCLFGKVFNQEFGFSPSPDTWISTSFMGELYWNFSWAGLLVGMLFVGFTFGFVGIITNTYVIKNVTRFLILISALYLLVIKFESGMAQQYSLFIRTIIIILFLHFFMRKRKRSKSL